METIKSGAHIKSGAYTKFPLAGDINWMETSLASVMFVSFIRSHSLGTLIEWKQDEDEYWRIGELQGSHSLGTLIEWKQFKEKKNHT